MNKILLRLTMMVAMLTGAASYAGAANYDNPIQGVLRAIFGNSITVEVPSLVSKSPTSDDQNGSLTFVVNSSTNYTNFHQLSDLKEGDTVSVGYTGDFDTKTKQVVANTITKVEDNPEAVVVNPENTANPQYVVTSVPASGSTDSTGATQTVTTTTTTQVNSP